jgi:dolichol-phosphate mannosyltransferase
LNAERGTFPPLVNPNISRDYVYVDDIVDSFILAALHCEAMRGEIYNVATEKKSTIRNLAEISRNVTKMKTRPVFSTMPNRDWDLSNWYGTAKKFRKAVGWNPKSSIESGLKKTILWHTKNHLWHL